MCDCKVFYDNGICKFIFRMLKCIIKWNVMIIILNKYW